MIGAIPATHWRCDCVPDLGPAHCHTCGAAAGRPVEFVDCPGTPAHATR